MATILAIDPTWHCDECKVGRGLLTLGCRTCIERSKAREANASHVGRSRGGGGGTIFTVTGGTGGAAASSVVGPATVLANNDMLSRGPIERAAHEAEMQRLRANALADKCGQLQHERDEAVRRAEAAEAKVYRLERKGTR